MFEDLDEELVQLGFPEIHDFNVVAVVEKRRQKLLDRAAQRLAEKSKRKCSYCQKSLDIKHVQIICGDEDCKRKAAAQHAKEYRDRRRKPVLVHRAICCVICNKEFQHPSNRHGPPKKVCSKECGVEERKLKYQAKVKEQEATNETP